MRISDWSSDVCSSDLVRRVLKLAALHPTILKAFQKDEIGMGAAQAFALTDDQDRQLEVFKRTGDNAHQIRAMLTQEKVADTDKHFRIRSEEHTSELQSLMHTSYAVSCLKKNTNTNAQHQRTTTQTNTTLHTYTI